VSIWLVVAVVIGIIAFVFYRKEIIKLRSSIAVPLLAFYLSFVATITVIARIPSHKAQYQLAVFWTYRAIANGETHYCAEIFWNIILFIPIGFLLMLLLTHKHSWITALITGLLMSVSIEVIQLVFHRGLFEFDDIIHNTLGTVIGIGTFAFVNFLGKKLTGK
jgi:glycopeptide antibiotics resistance protein